MCACAQPGDLDPRSVLPQMQPQTCRCSWRLPSPHTGRTSSRPHSQVFIPHWALAFTLCLLEGAPVHREEQGGCGDGWEGSRDWIRELVARNLCPGHVVPVFALAEVISGSISQEEKIFRAGGLLVPYNCTCDLLPPPHQDGDCIRSTLTPARYPTHSR